ncbi:hypothetical protein V1511DRAFT_511596 [Dipodascopsis uninucleata]
MPPLRRRARSTKKVATSSQAAEKVNAAAKYDTSKPASTQQSTRASSNAPSSMNGEGTQQQQQQQQQSTQGTLNDDSTGSAPPSIEIHPLHHSPVKTEQLQDTPDSSTTMPRSRTRVTAAAESRHSDTTETIRPNELANSKDFTTILQPQHNASEWNAIKSSPRTHNLARFINPSQSPLLQKVAAANFTENDIMKLKEEMKIRREELRKKYALAAKAVRLRLEMRVHRIPRHLRNKTIRELKEMASSCETVNKS